MSLSRNHDPVTQNNPLFSLHRTITFDHIMAQRSELSLLHIVMVISVHFWMFWMFIPSCFIIPLKAVEQMPPSAQWCGWRVKFGRKKKVPKYNRSLDLFILSKRVMISEKRHCHWANFQPFSVVLSTTSWRPSRSIISNTMQTSLQPVSTKQRNSQQNNLDAWMALQARGEIWMSNFWMNCPFKIKYLLFNVLSSSSTFGLLYVFWHFFL